MSDDDASSEGSIRSVVRALSLLAALNEWPKMTLAELHRTLSLPKPTIYRLLTTLRAEGYVCSEGGQGVYRVTEKVRKLGGGYTKRSLVVDVGAPIARRVTREIKWPLAIGTLEHSLIVVRYSTMPYSPLAVQATTIGHRLSLVESAMGTAYLSACDVEQRQELLRLLAAGQKEKDFSLDAAELAVRTAQRRGYGLRLPSQRGMSATVAVVIPCASGIAGVLSMTTFGALMNARLIAQYVPILKQTASEIGRAVDDKPLSAL